MIRCAACGSLNDEGMRFCTTCGARLDGADAALDETQKLRMPAGAEPEGLSEDAPQTVVCKNCGAILDADARFCEMCGAAVSGHADAGDALSAQEGSMPAGSHASAEPSQHKGPKKASAFAVAALALTAIAVVAVLVVIGMGRAGQSSDAGDTAAEAAVEPADAAGQGKTTEEPAEAEQKEATADSAEAEQDTQPEARAEEADVKREQANSDAPRVADAARGVSSNLGTLINGGHMCYAGADKVFFAVPEDGTYWDTRKIVCGTAAGKGMRDVYTAPSDTINLYHITAVGDYLVFNQVIEHNSSVVVASSDGAYHQEIARCDDWSLCQVEDGWVYYQYGDCIYRCDLEGEKTDTVMKLRGRLLWRVMGDDIYTFGANEGTEVVRYDPTRSKSTVFTASPGRIVTNAYPVDGNRLLVLETEPDETAGEILLVDIGNQSQKVLASGRNFTRMCNDDKGVYYTVKVRDDVYRIGYVGFDGAAIGSEREISGGEVRYTNVMAPINTVCFGLIKEGNQCSIGCMNGVGDAQGTIGKPWYLM